MKVGVARLTLLIPGARTLKDRRQVVRSFRDRVRARGSVSIAEVSGAEQTDLACFGVAAVAQDAAEADALLARVIEEARSLPDAVLAEVATEVVGFGSGWARAQTRLEAELGEDEGDGWPPRVAPVRRGKGSPG